MLAEKLKDLRRIKKITQEEFAKEMNVSKGAVAMWETGKRTPDLSTIKKIAKYFNISIDGLLGGEPMILGTEIEAIIKNIAIEVKEPYEKLVDIYLNNSFPQVINYNSLLYFFSHYLGKTLYVSYDNPLSRKQMVILNEIKSLSEEELDRVDCYIEKLKELKAMENMSDPHIVVKKRH